jgi:hypothetical protein
MTPNTVRSQASRIAEATQGWARPRTLRKARSVTLVPCSFRESGAERELNSLREARPGGATMHLSRLFDHPWNLGDFGDEQTRRPDQRLLLHQPPAALREPFAGFLAVLYTSAPILARNSPAMKPAKARSQLRKRARLLARILVEL